MSTLRLPQKLFVVVAEGQLPQVLWLQRGQQIEPHVAIYKPAKDKNSDFPKIVIDTTQQGIEP